MKDKDVISRRGTSSKTRIETNSTSTQWKDHIPVGGAHPVKQGLKLRAAKEGISFYRVGGAHPVKQGLKHRTRYGVGYFLDVVGGAHPVKQELKLIARINKKTIKKSRRGTSSKTRIETKSCKFNHFILLLSAGHIQ